MKRLLRVAKRISKRVRFKLGDWWRWAKKPGPHGESQRFAALTKLAQRHEQLAWERYKRHHRAKDKRAALRWKRIRWVYNARRVRAKRRWRKGREHGDGGAPKWEPWMASGNAFAGVSDKTLAVAAYQVVVLNQTVTDFYEYGGHVSGSLHYQRRAVDTAGGDMCGAAGKTRDHFGVGYFAELFSPCSWYIKNGALLSTGGGPFPGHGDHGHYGTPA